MNDAIEISMLKNEAKWWQAHAALPGIIREHVGHPIAGVEVGVAFGSMSAWLMRQFSRLHLTSVDSFCQYDPNDSLSPLMAGHGDELHRFVLRRLSSEFGQRSTLLRLTSVLAAGTVGDGTQDFVFIDADHRKDAVVADIRAWRRKIRSGGLLCGHDYSPRFQGVVDAVTQEVGSVEVNEPSTIWWAVMP